MSRTILPYQPSPVQAEGHRQILQAHIMQQLVIGTLGKGGIESHHWMLAISGQSCRQSHSMFLGYAHIQEPAGIFILEGAETCAGRHSCCDGYQFRPFLCQFQQSFAEYRCIRRCSPGFFRRFSRGQVKFSHPVELAGIVFSRSVPLSLHGMHMNQQGTIHLPHLVEHILKQADVMSIQRPQITEAHFLKEGSWHQHGAYAILDLVGSFQYFAANAGNA